MVFTYTLRIYSEYPISNGGKPGGVKPYTWDDHNMDADIAIHRAHGPSMYWYKTCESDAWQQRKKIQLPVLKKHPAKKSKKKAN